MSEVRRYYWDSSVFCSFLNKEQNRHDIVKTLLNDADAGRSQVITSSLTLVEVLKIKGSNAIMAKRESELRNFFEYPFIHIVNAERSICERAREHVWKNGMKPKDAVHLATADFASKIVPIHELFSWDADFTTLDGKLPELKFRLMAPYVKEPELPFDQATEGEE